MIEAAALARTRSGLLFLRAAMWIGILTALLTLAAIFWFNDRADRIIDEGQRRIAVLLAQGMAIAVESPLITRDYSELEARLKQSVAHEELLAAMVADTAGRVVSYVRQRAGEGPPAAVFDIDRVDLPTAPAQFEPRPSGGIAYWLRIDASRPIGWLRLEMQLSAADDTLRQTRRQLNAVFITAAITFMALMILVLFRTYSSVARRELGLLKRQEALEVFAYRDGLTSIPNRHLLMQRLEIGLAESQRRGLSLAVCFIDLDGFKQVNDQYGHEAGDRVLVEVAHRLEACLRQGDFVARLGGDEFVVLLPGVSQSPEGDDVLRRMLDAIGQPSGSVGSGVTVGASIGVAVYPSHGDSSEGLLAAADRAMYAVKRDGRNHWRYAEAA